MGSPSRCIALALVIRQVACTEPADATAQGSTTSASADDGSSTTTTSATTSETGGCVPACVAPAVCEGQVCVPPGDTGADSTSTSTSETTDALVFDVGIMPDAPVMECVQCEIALMTTQSNAMHAIAGMPLFLEALLDGHLVFGLAEANAGRVAFSGDGNVLYREGTCPLWPWLGATGDEPPRVLCIGADWPCHGETGPPNPPLEINFLHMYDGILDYGGITLPVEYAADPAALRDDYDLVVYIAVHDFATGSWDFVPEDVETLETFVRGEGGGLYLVGEYYGAMEPTHVSALNQMAAPFDIEFEALSLDWGPAGAMVEIDCFPDPAR